MNNIKNTKGDFSIISLIFFITLLISLISIMAINMVWYKVYKATNKDYINTMNFSYIHSAKQYARSTIKNVIKLINRDRKSMIINAKKNILADPKITKFFSELVIAYRGNLTRNRARVLMQHYLTNLTTNSLTKEYYIFDTKGRCIVNPFNVDLNNTNLTNLKDFQENFIIQDIIKKAKTERISFISNQFWPYNWYDLRASNIKKPGITFVRYNSEFNWIFVTRINVNSLIKQLKKKWIENLSLYRYGRKEHGYIFVAKLYNINGGTCFARTLVNAGNHSIVGKCVSEEFQDITGFKFRKAYLADLRKHGYSFLKYHYYVPNSNQIQLKISYIELYKPWNWIIGTGIYMDDLQPIINIEDKKVKAQTMSIMKIITTISIIVVLFLSLFYIFFQNILHKSTDKVFKDLEKSLKKAIYIDKNKYKIREVKRIAKNFNSSIKQFKLYEEEFIESFINFMEARDIYTKGHSQRVAYYSRNIAIELGLDEKTQEKIYKAGLLHDIGKIGIPDNILLKPGNLTDNEYYIMKQHTILSYEMLNKLEHFQYLADCVRSHHEKCDGSGYPDKLICGRIPLGAKILAIADIFDALTTTRPYRNAYSIDEAIEILKKEKLDQDIIKKVESKLAEICIQENSIEASFMPEEIDTLRNKIFTVDYMTGLKHRSIFLQNIQDLINKNQKFVFVMINIKNVSDINYIFSPKVGDEIITCTARAMLSMGEKLKVCNIDLMSRAYADIFYIAHLLPDNINVNEARKMITFAKERLYKEFLEIFSKSSFFKLKDNKGKTIIEYINFHLIHAIYPDDAKTINKLIYLTEKNKNRIT